ncbi:hypothetical protein C8R46DRAFT_1245963 [Mycena filopes]|nr:hypothetical protein C8R46DRAFT_1245963 [Mycena filopes]
MSSASSSAFTLIDDQDLTKVAYTGTWVPGGSPSEHDATVSSSLNAGDSFAVSFTGTAIAVYGTYDSSSAGVQTSYAVDGGSPATVTSSSSPLDSYQKLFWQSAPLSSGSHQLVVTMKKVNAGQADGEGTIWFDYFNVTHTADTTSSSSSASQAQSSSAKSPGTKGSATAKSPNPSSTNDASALPVSTKKSSHTGVIAGVVIALIVLLALAAFFLRHKRRQRYIRNMTAANGPPPGSTQPFLPLSSPSPQTPPMSSYAGAAPVLAASAPGSPYTPAGGPGGFDSRLTYAAGAPYGAQPYTPPPGQGYAPPAGPPPQSQAQSEAAYDPYAAIGASMAMAPQSSYAPSASYAPSISSSMPSTTTTTRGPLSVVGGASTREEYGDSIADLKRRQQQVVNSYEQGIGGSGQGPIVQHTDSGVRALDPAGATELPPVYTPN